MTSLVGPLVNPNSLEDRFDRTVPRRSRFRHPVLVFLFWTSLAAAATGAILHYHIGF